MVIADTKLLFGAAHSLGLKARNGCNFYFAAAYSAARKRKRNLHTYRNIGRAADYIANLAACVNL